MYYKDLGYKTYDGYLEGDEWNEIHEFYYRRCGPYRCRICGKTTALVLHKRSYKHLTMRSLRKTYVVELFIVFYLKKYMCWLCKSCNKKVHFKNGVKIPLQYELLVQRERDVYTNSLWRKILNKRPSDLLNALERFLATYSV